MEQLELFEWRVIRRREPCRNCKPNESTGAFEIVSKIVLTDDRGDIVYDGNGNEITICPVCEFSKSLRIKQREVFAIAGV